MRKPRFIKKFSLRSKVLDAKLDKTGMVLVIFTILFAVLTVLFYKFLYRADLTQSRTFSLSDSTKEIISNLDEDVTLDVYYSSNLPADYIAVRRDIIDLLEEYGNLSEGKVKVNISDPEAEDFKTKATEAGIREVSYSEFAGDSLEIATSFLGLVVSQGEQSEVLEFLPRITDIEYQVTSAITKLETEDKATIAFLIDHRENNLYADYVSLYDELNNLYNVEELSLAEGKPIDVDVIKALIIAAPKDDFSDRDLFELEQYMLKGGKVVVLADWYDLDVQEPTLNQNSSNLYEFLENYGIKVDKQVLLDESFSPIPAGLGGITYPYWLLVQPQNINLSIPAFSNLDSLNLFWANSISLDQKEGIDYRTLFTTTDRAWVQTSEEETINVDVQQDFIPTDQKGYILGIEATSEKLDSLYKDKSLPALADENAKSLRKKSDEIVDDGELGLYVIADADFVSNDFYQLNPNNYSFMLNLLGLITNTNDLGSIRAKVVESRPLQETSQQKKNVYKAVNVAAMPIVISFTGLALNSYNRKRKSSI